MPYDVLGVISRAILDGKCVSTHYEGKRRLLHPYGLVMRRTEDLSAGGGRSCVADVPPPDLTRPISLCAYDRCRVERQEQPGARSLRCRVLLTTGAWKPTRTRRPACQKRVYAETEYQTAQRQPTARSRGVSAVRRQKTERERADQSHAHRTRYPCIAPAHRVDHGPTRPGGGDGAREASRLHRRESLQCTRSTVGLNHVTNLRGRSLSCSSYHGRVMRELPHAKAPGQPVHTLHQPEPSDAEVDRYDPPEVGSRDAAGLQPPRRVDDPRL